MNSVVIRRRALGSTRSITTNRPCLEPAPADELDAWAERCAAADRREAEHAGAEVG